jgi:hypothetical protein
MSFRDLLRGYKHSKLAVNYRDRRVPPEDMAIIGISEAEPDIVDDGKPGHLVILMMVIDEIPYEAIWRDWAGQDVHFLVHAKHPDRVNSPWARERLVASNLRPEWGSLELVEAALLLLKEALVRTPAEHFALVSESCVPVVGCASLIRDLTAVNRSWLRLSREPTNGYVQSGQFAPLQKVMGHDKVAKASQWCVLTRRDARGVLGLDGLLALFRTSRCRCPDEMYFASALVYLGAHVQDREVTYTRWADACDKSPQYLSLQELKGVVETKTHFFSRKLRLAPAEVSKVLNEAKVITY